MKKEKPKLTIELLNKFYEDMKKHPDALVLIEIQPGICAYVTREEANKHYASRKVLLDK